MRLFDRGIQVYLLGLAFIGSLAIVWGTNGFVLENTAAATGWPLMIVVAVVMVVLGVVIRRRSETSEGEPPRDRRPWTSRR